MFKVNPKASFGATLPPGEESDDDNISLTSTVDNHDPDEEYVVEGVRAEHRFPDGEMYYLVEWAGFALHESTWEPEANLGPELKAMWEEDKAKHASGELEPFDLRKFYDAYDAAEKAKKERHRRRNRKRKRLGLLLTEPLEDSSEDEAVEDPGVGAVDENSTTSRASAGDRKKTSERTSTSESAPIVSVPDGPQIREEPMALPTARVDMSGRAQQEARPPAKPRQPSDPNVGITGYQGTARPSTKAPTAPASTKPKLSAPTPAARPAPASKMKTLTAKKSTSQSAGNIFVSGKRRKGRPGLEDVMADTSREPRLFDKHRYRRLAELRGRAKEDIAPDPSRIALIDLRTGQALGPRNSDALVQSPSEMSPREEEASPATTVPQVTPATANEPSPAPANPDPAVEVQDAEPPKKKRKSVRFVDNDDDQSLFVQRTDPMDIDGAAPESPKGPPSPALRRPSLKTDLWTPPGSETQSLDKTLSIGQFSVAATFTNLPQENSGSPAWLADFLAEDPLSFGHACLPDTAQAQQVGLGLIKECFLASGPVLPKDDGAGLERLASYLATSLLAVFWGRAWYSVLIYPTKCEEWRWLPLNRDPLSPSEAQLGYLIFSSIDWMSMLPPVAGPSVPQPVPDESVAESKESAFSPEALLMKRLFSFDYGKLLPAATRSTKEHNFFLAFPASQRNLAQALCRWLRSNNDNCNIFTSLRPGAWEAFCARTGKAPEKTSGVIIIHEMLTWSMRRFPHLSRKLTSTPDEFWCFAEPVYGLPLYPSISTPEYLVPPGEMQLTRLFPYRTAIFLTPSFLVSEPRRSLQFFQWYTQFSNKLFAYKLITAHNIHEYMTELADERYQARQDLWNQPGEVDILANLSALSREECGCRYEAALIAEDLDITRMTKAGLFALDEDSSPIVYADPSIDPNDEQSLVNWFGWWATLRADQFRKFHVIGSSRAIDKPECKSGERTIRIPKYSRVTLNDPDAVLEVVQEEVTAPGVDSGDGSNEVQAAPREDELTRFYKGPWAFRSTLISREHMDYFAHRVEEAMRSVEGRRWWVCYKYPVSWLDFTMATHYKDFNADFKRINDWFNYARPFSGSRSDEDPGDRKSFIRYNTYVGFFYTIDKEWDEDDRPSETTPQRYPWIAIYRPVNPHIRPFRRCELIIWDPAARVRYSDGKAPAEKDLIFMQRQLIQFVRDHCEGKNHGTYLDQVWFGGWDWPPECDDQYPIDVTLRFLRCLLCDLRELVPAPEPVMETKGYKRVILDSNSDASPFALERHPSAADAEAVPMDVDSPSVRDDQSSVVEEEDENTRIIFHPPRGRSSMTCDKFRSKCVNRLYDEARLARARDSRATHMTFRYPSTMEWYNQQRAEGRGYEHLNVEPWEEVFKKLKIGDIAKGEDRSAGGSDGSDGRRREESIGSG
ncbi:hypothetical protein VTJ49DRAFT_1189 [Mycothermus thermophilus]|uniref:Chromo domain-containing protein n=1 Tax=Humicola insolens TaxID=85995 RepID=A0ABR3VDC8_HUMIN